jgi:hypothetical protein
MHAVLCRFGVIYVAVYVWCVYLLDDMMCTACAHCHTKIVHYRRSTDKCASEHASPGNHGQLACYWGSQGIGNGDPLIYACMQGIFPFQFLTFKGINLVKLCSDPYQYIRHFACIHMSRVHAYMPSRLGEMAWHASVFSIKVATMCNCHGTVPFRPGEAPGVVYVNVHAYQLLSLNRANPLQSSYGRAPTERNQTKYLSSLVHHQATTTAL